MKFYKFVIVDINAVTLTQKEEPVLISSVFENHYPSPLYTSMYLGRKKSLKHGK